MTVTGMFFINVVSGNDMWLNMFHSWGKHNTANYPSKQPLGGPFASSQSYMYHCPTMNPQLEMVDSWVYHITSFGGHGCEYLPHGRVEQIRFSNYSSPPAR